MANQSSGNVVASIKREAVFGVAEASGAGATQLRLIDSDGLKQTRVKIETAERSPDQLKRLFRAGSKSTAGTMNTQLTVGGESDLLLESMARGTAAAKASYAGISTSVELVKVVTPAVPVYHSYTVEQRDIGIDQSELFLGTRLTGLHMVMRPNGIVTCAWEFMGLQRNILTTSQSPWFTSPAVTSGLPLIADDSAILVGGSPILTLTGFDLTLSIAAGVEPTIGSLVSPDVFMNDLTLSGTITAIRTSLDALTDMDAETETTMQIVMTEPVVGLKPTIGIVLPKMKIGDVTAPFLGGDTAKIETREVSFGPNSSSNAVEFYTSTSTLTAYVP